MTEPGPLTASELDAIDAWWRAANYLSVGQIYLLGNPLLAEPLRPEHVKPRLLGHWGTTPGLNLIYAHLNRVIRNQDLNAIYICGPGHGGPGMVANTYLEGTYSELYPGITRDTAGMARLFRQFSFPGGIPSHDAPETPGSIHEGGELGYSLAHAYGAAFDNPDLIVACVIGDGEAETGPLAASWHSNKFLDPARDGAVLPILHLNGYKIANPTVLARIGDDELSALLTGYGYRPYLVEGAEPAAVHQQLAATIDQIIDADPVNQPDAAAQLGSLAAQKGGGDVGDQLRKVRLPRPVNHGDLRHDDLGLVQRPEHPRITRCGSFCGGIGGTGYGILLVRLFKGARKDEPTAGAVFSGGQEEVERGDEVVLQDRQHHFEVARTRHQTREMIRPVRQDSPDQLSRCLQVD
jgi:hypothetical protein